MKIKRQLIFALIVIFAFVSLTVNIGSVDAATSRVAIISKLEGTVEVQKSGGKKTLKGFKNMSLNEGDVVSTGSKSSVELKFSNGTSTDDTLVLESNTTVTFSKLSNRNGTVTKVKMKNGKAWVDVKSIENSSDDFQLETPTAIMGVRGTNFFVGIDPSTGKSVLAMFAGVVKLLTDGDNYQNSSNVYPSQIFYTARDGELLGNMTNDSIAQLLQNSTPAAIASVIENLQKIKEENDQLIEQFHLENQDNLDPELQELLDNDVLRTNIERIAAAVLKEAAGKNLISASEQEELMTRLFGEAARNTEDELIGDKKNNEYDFILNQKTKEMLDQLDKSKMLEDKKTQLIAEQERKRKELEEQQKKREQEALDRYLSTLPQNERDALLQARDRVDRGTRPSPTPPVTTPSTPSQPTQGWSSVTKPINVTYGESSSTVPLEYSLVNVGTRTLRLSAPIQVGIDSAVTFEPASQALTITSLAINGETVPAGENGSFTWNLPAETMDVEVTLGMSHATFGTAQFTLQAQLQYSEALSPIIVKEPENSTVTVGGSIVLTVEAEAADSGNLTYQWYSNLNNSTSGGSAINGATGPMYMAPAAVAGTSYYYVVITNTNSNVSGVKTAVTVSRAAQVIVQPIVNAAVPAIGSQPQDVTADVGEQITLSVGASSPDGGQLSYQWYTAGGQLNGLNIQGVAAVSLEPSVEGGVPIENATAASYNVPTSAAGTSYYFVVVTNKNNNVNGATTATATSRIAKVEVIINAAEPEIITESQDVNANEGDEVRLSVEADASDGGVLTYQWYRSDARDVAGELIQGADDSEYTVPTAEVGTSYYYVVITNTNTAVNGATTATATSRSIKVIVNSLIHAAEPVIVTEPQNITVGEGEEAMLTVSASSPDGGGLTYQWYVNTEPSNTGGTAVSGGPNASYYAPTNEMGTKYYYVVVTNTNNSVNGAIIAQKASEVATVTVSIDAAKPVINEQPQDVTANEGDEVKLSVDANSPDGGALTYQWYRSDDSEATGELIQGADDFEYTVPTAEVGTSYYYVVITNTNTQVNGLTTATTTSEMVEVVVNALIHAAEPVIVTEPQNITVGEGEEAMLTVSASSPDGGGLTYQWYVNTEPSNTGGTAVSGGPNASYYAPTNEMGTKYYYVVVTNTNNGVTGTKTAQKASAVATVTVIKNAAEPVIVTEPQSITVREGEEAFLTVSASSPDGGGLTYQWYVNTEPSNTGGTAVSGGPNASYYAPTNEMGTKYYYVVVTNTNNSVNGAIIAQKASEVAAVTVSVDAAEPVIVTQPQDYTGSFGSEVTLEVGATISDEGNLSYQWYSNSQPIATGGTLIEGATVAAYSFTPVHIGTHYYYVVVINTNNEVNGENIVQKTSEVAAVNISVEAPSITTNIESRNIELDSEYMMSIEATTELPGDLSYQWYVNDVNSFDSATAIAGATSYDYNVPTNELGVNYYFVVVTNTIESQGQTASESTYSQIAQIEVLEEVIDAAIPEITSEFYGYSIHKGEVTQLMVFADVECEAKSNLTYQWYVTDDVRNDGIAIAGATSNSVNISGDELGTKYYYVVVTNTDESATGIKTASARSEMEEITVLPPFQFYYVDGYEAYMDYYSTDTLGRYAVSERIYMENSDSQVKVVPYNDDNYTLTKVEIIGTAEEYIAEDGAVLLSLDPGNYEIRITMQDFDMQQESYILEFEIAEPVSWEDYELPFEVGIYNSDFGYYNELSLIKNENDYSQVYGAPYPSLQGTGNILQLSLKYDDLWVDSVVVGETSLEPEDGVYSWELNPTAEPLSIRIYVRHVYLGERPYWIELYSWEQYDEPIDLMVRYKDSEFPDFVEYSQTGSGSMYAFLDTEQLVFEEDMQISISSYAEEYTIYEVYHYDEVIEYNEGEYVITLTSDNVRKSPIFIQLNHYVLGNYEIQLKLIMDAEPTEAPVKMMLNNDGVESRVTLFGNPQPTWENYVELNATYDLNAGSSNNIYFDVLNEDHQIEALHEDHGGGSTTQVEFNYDEGRYIATVNEAGERVFILTVMDNRTSTLIQYRITVEFRYPL